MKLERIKIQNLRGIEEIEINLHDFTSVIGPNNVGKSTVLRAIELFLSGHKPQLEEWYHNDYSRSIRIEGVFVELTDWERATSGISGAVYDGSLTLAYSCETKEDSNGVKPDSVIYEAFVPEESFEGFSEKWSECSEDIQRIAEALGESSQTWRRKNSRTMVRDFIRINHPDLISIEGEPRWTTDPISINSALQQAIPNVIFIPAVKDATDEANASSRSRNAIKQIIDEIFLPQIRQQQEFADIQNAVQNLERKLTGAADDSIQEVTRISGTITNRLKSLIDAEVKLFVEPPELQKLLGANVGLKIVDQELETHIGLQGHGLQRTLIFSLLEVVGMETAKTDSQSENAPSRSNIILFEEPELFIHPHLMRKLRDVLKLISGKDNWQVIISTHSPVLINVGEDPESLIILRKEDGVSTKMQLDSNPFQSEEGNDEQSENWRAVRATMNFHPTVGEAFFAKETVLVEGDTELAILKHSDNLYVEFGIDPRSAHDISVVSCAGKKTIPGMARLLSKFGIPFKVVHDRDRHGKTDAQLENADGRLSFFENVRIAAEVQDPGKIFICEDEVEWLIFEEGNYPAGSKPFNAWQRIQDILDESKEELKKEDFPGLKRLLEFVYESAISTPD